jgi:hypothetical protein
MPLKIRVPDSALHSQTINISSNTYTIKYKYNTSDLSWYISLYTVDDEIILGDTKVMPNQNLTGRFPYYQVFTGGNIWCLRTKNDFTPINRNNLGIGKLYELVYLTTAEELELGIRDTIQL